MQIRLLRPSVHQLDLSSAELNWITSALGSFNSMAEGAENTDGLFRHLAAYCRDNGTARRAAERDGRISFYPA